MAPCVPVPPLARLQFICVRPSARPCSRTCSCCLLSRPHLCWAGAAGRPRMRHHQHQMTH